MRLQVFAEAACWPLKAPFTISRRTFVASLITTVRIRDADGNEGFGECEPHEWDEAEGLEGLRAVGLEPGAWATPDWATSDLTREALLARLPRSPVRNAIDCALWDLESKRRGARANMLVGMDWKPLTVIPTIGIDTPDRMAATAATFGPVTLVKVKLGAQDGRDAERMEAVSAALPSTPLLIDVNAGWTPDTLAAMLPVARRCKVRIIEQPLPPELDESMPQPVEGVFYCADESCLDRSSLDRIRPYFQYINIKLDKAGGLTEALALRAEAERLGMGVMVGMMSGTSLAVAPASLLAQGLEVVDLELGFLRQDREPAMRIDGDQLLVPQPALWG